MTHYLAVRISRAGDTRQTSYCWQWRLLCLQNTRTHNITNTPSHFLNKQVYLNTMRCQNASLCFNSAFSVAIWLTIDFQVSTHTCRWNCFTMWYEEGGIPFGHSREDWLPSINLLRHLLLIQWNTSFHLLYPSPDFISFCVIPALFSSPAIPSIIHMQNIEIVPTLNILSAKSYHITWNRH